jgi:hypothetical protein
MAASLKIRQMRYVLNVYADPIRICINLLNDQTFK